jgi:hypothetical protein
VRSDDDGEVPPDNQPSEMQSDEFSPSSDVYEWRRDGIDGCAQLQGCLALITNGRGGFLNLLLGISPDGSDVFVYTHSQLLSQDNDNAGDIYDARIDGGLPGPAPRPTECEASACSTPPSAPTDATPSSSTYQGPGNVVEPSKAPAVVRKKTVKCAKGKKLSHGKCLKPKPKPKKKAKARKTANKRKARS